ncbi:MAG: heme-binding protein [Pseudomonadota bacterium]
MSFLEADASLNDEALQAMLSAAIEKAGAIGVPECIVIVDPSCVDLLSFRMTGAKVMSLQSARAKAITSASNRAPSGGIPPEFAPAVGAATGGKVTNLQGGLPIVIDGYHLGGIGVGSGSPDQDLTVARAALAAIGAATFD